MSLFSIEDRKKSYGLHNIHNRKSRAYCNLSLLDPVHMVFMMSYPIWIS